MLHEVTEAYQGALLSQAFGISSPASNQKGSVYAQAHGKATPQTATITETIYDKNGAVLSMGPGNTYPSSLKTVHWSVNDTKGNKVLLQVLVNLNLPSVRFASPPK